MEYFYIVVLVRSSTTETQGPLTRFHLHHMAFIQIVSTAITNHILCKGVPCVIMYFIN